MDIPVTLVARRGRFDLVPASHSSALLAGFLALSRDMTVLAHALLLHILALARARLRSSRALVHARRRARTAGLLAILADLLVVLAGVLLVRALVLTPNVDAPGSV